MLKIISNFKIIFYIINFVIVPSIFGATNAYHTGPRSEIILQYGRFKSHQGHEQKINIQDLIGDYFSVKNKNTDNNIYGLSFFLPESTFFHINFSMGISAYYLKDISVKGDISQELLYTNLSYQYKIRNIPVYLDFRKYLYISNTLVPFVDIGIGPNFLKTYEYQEFSLDDLTIPNQAFMGANQVKLSGTAGFGLRYKSIELAYKYFYLGEGILNSTNPLILNNLTTGHSHAQSIMASIKF